MRYYRAVLLTLLALLSTPANAEPPPAAPTATSASAELAPEPAAEPLAIPVPAEPAPQAAPPPASTPEQAAPVLVPTPAPSAAAESTAIKSPVPKPTPADSKIIRDPVGIGVGVAIGLPIGASVSYKNHLDGMWFDGALGWDSATQSAAIHLDVLYTLATLHSPDIEEISFPFYIGIGPRFRISSPTSGTSTGYAPSNLAIRIPLGMAFYHEGVPIEGFVEIAPGVGMLPRPRGTFDIAIGGRFYLPQVNSLAQ